MFLSHVAIILAIAALAAVSVAIDGYQCTEEENVFQFENIDLVQQEICDTDVPWLLAQLLYPDASIFIDVGGNAGYTTARMVGMWAPGHGYNRITLGKAIQSDIAAGKRSASFTSNTVCDDAHQPDDPLLSKPNKHRTNIQVYMFDGQMEHVTNTLNAIKGHFPKISVGDSHRISRMNNSSRSSAAGDGYSEVTAHIAYIHAAVTNSVPSGVTHGYFTQVEHEGGQLKMLSKDERGKAPPGQRLVRVTTIDRFCSKHGLNKVDIIKIDAEGHDAEVMEGALETLQKRGVKMITAETPELFIGEKMDKMIEDLDEKFGFDCYLNGKNERVMLRLTKCWKKGIRQDYAKYPKCDEGEKCPEQIRSTHGRISGNMYCVSRVNAPSLAEAFLQRSLHQWATPARPEDNVRGHYYKDALLFNVPGSFNPDGKVTLSDGGALERFSSRDPVTGEKKWHNSLQN